MNKRLPHWVMPCCVIALLAISAYGLVLGNDYVWDDRYFLVDYTWISTIGDALRASLEPLFGQRAYVRPIPLFSLYMEAIISDRNPAVSHGVNLLIHICSSILVYLIAHRAWSEAAPAAASWPPLLVASMFTVHPALTENVVWISSRFDLLATLFALCAIWVAVGRSPDGRRALYVGALFLLGALSKESVAVLPAILGAMALLQGASVAGRVDVRLADAFTKRQVMMYAAILAAGCVYLVIRYLVLSDADLFRSGPMPIEEHVVRMGLSLYKYVKLTFLPFVGNSPHHTFIWNESMGVVDYLWPVLAGFSVLCASLLMALQRKRAGWWLLVWLACYLPVLHVVPMTIGGNIVHQRFMYLPTATLLALSPYIFARVKLSTFGRRAVLVVGGLLVALSIMICNTIVPAWKNDMTLWKWTVAMEPGSVEARENLIWSYLEAGMFDDANAQMAFIREHGMKTSGAVAVNMGVAHYRRGEFDEAQSYYNIAETVIDSMPKGQRARLLSNIAINYAARGDVDRARKYLLNSLRLDRRNTTALGQLFAYCGVDRVMLEGYSSEEISRARDSEKNVREVLIKAVPGIVEEGGFCPSMDVLRSAGF